MSWNQERNLEDKWSTFVFTLQENDRYGRPESYTEEDKVQVSVFPDFAIDLKPVFDSIGM